MGGRGAVATRVRPVVSARMALHASVHALRHPAALAFGGVYLAATVALVVTGHADLLAFQISIDALLAVLCALTLAMTAGAPSDMHIGSAGDGQGTFSPQPPPAPAVSLSRRERQHANLNQPEERVAARDRLCPALQLAFTALYTAYVAVLINGHAPAPVPLAALNSAADHLPMYVRDPLLYFALPALALAAPGLRRRELGLGRGWRAWRVTAVWSVVPLYVVALALAAGAATPSALFDSLAGNVLRNGFFEEFLWRGAVLGRLRPLMGTGWAVALSSLGFGLWHLGPDTSRLGGNLAAGLAYCVVCQATVGLGFAVAYVRTRNLLAPSVAHVLFNVA